MMLVGNAIWKFVRYERKENMSKAEMLGLLDEVLGQSQGTLKGEESLSSLKGWDSVAMMGYIALMHENF